MILLISIKKALNRKMLRKVVLEKIAAISSRTHGDARKAVELLSKSAQIAEREGSAVTIDVVDVSLEEIERDKYVAMIKSAPRQLHPALYAIMALAANSKNLYKSVIAIRPITRFVLRLNCDTGPNEPFQVWCHNSISTVYSGTNCFPRPVWQKERNHGEFSGGCLRKIKGSNP